MTFIAIVIICGCRLHACLLAWEPSITSSHGDRGHDVTFNPWLPDAGPKRGFSRLPCRIVLYFGCWSAHLIKRNTHLNSSYQMEHSAHIKRNTHIIKRNSKEYSSWNTHIIKRNTHHGTLILSKGTQRNTHH